MVCRTYVFIDICHVEIELLITIPESTRDVICVVVQTIIWQRAGSIYKVLAIPYLLLHGEVE